MKNKTLSNEERFELIKRNTQEIVLEEELKKLLLERKIRLFIGALQLQENPL